MFYCMVVPMYTTVADSSIGNISKIIISETSAYDKQLPNIFSCIINTLCCLFKYLKSERNITV